MQLMKVFIKTHGRILFVGLVFAIMLQGCSEPFIKTNVTVDMGNGVEKCSAKKRRWGHATAQFPGQDQQLVAQDNNGPVLPSGTPIKCRSGSNKCHGTPGDCYGMNCINRIKNISSNQGDCYCGCPF